jgi:glycerol kinase
MTSNNLLMQTLADFLDAPVVRPMVAETTCLGAAYAAGLAVGFWRDTDELRQHSHESRRWEPQWSEEQREAGHAGWKKAVERTLNWVEVD